MLDLIGTGLAHHDFPLEDGFFAGCILGRKNAYPSKGTCTLRAPCLRASGNPSAGGNETAAYFCGITVGWVKALVYTLAPVLAPSLASCSWSSTARQGRPGNGIRAGHHRLGGHGRRESLGGRDSLLGAVLGMLIFGVLRNAPRIPGRPFTVGSSSVSWSSSGQKYFGWERESVRLLAEIKDGAPVDLGRHRFRGGRVTAAKVEEYVAAWKKLESH